MDDHALVAALRKRDSEAPAALYDAHADRLYRYCRFRLRDDDAAQMALRDVVIVAEANIGRLRNPGRLAPWLYALARLECDRRRPPEAPESPGPDDTDHKAMAWRAVHAMPPLSREILELKVRHELSMADLGAVLDLPAQEAQLALARAYNDLEESLTAEVLAQDGDPRCSERTEILEDRDGELALPMRRTLASHARRCSICGACGQGTVSPAKVYGLLPEAIPPPELRQQVLDCFVDPAMASYRQSVTARSIEFNSSAFPVQHHPEKTYRDKSALFLALATAATVGLVLMVATVMVALHDDTTHKAAAPHTPAPGRSDTSPPTRVSPTWPLGATGSAAPPTARPTPGTFHQPPGRGSLAVSPRYLDLGEAITGSIELLAQNGPVSWSAHTPGRVRLSQVSGRLAPGQSTTLRFWLTRRPGSTGQATVAFQPGGTPVVITWRRPAPDITPRPTSPSPEPIKPPHSRPSTPLPTPPRPSAPPSPSASPSDSRPETTPPEPSSGPTEEPADS